MTSGKSLSIMPNPKNEDSKSVIKGEITSEKSLSLSIIPESENIEDENDFKVKNHETSSNSFKDFESSGSEYVPSGSQSDSESSIISTQDNVFYMKEESSNSKVIRYLKNLDNCYTQNKLFRKKDKPSTSTYEDNLIPQSTGIDQSPLLVANLAQTEISDMMQLPSKSPVTENNRNNLKQRSMMQLENELPLTTLINYNEQYTKKACAPERPTICPICYQDVITHFTRHLFRHHKNNKQVMLIKSFKPRSKDRLALVTALRKQGYFYLKTERNVLNPVRTSKNPNTDYFVCTYCLGHYTKKLLYKHVKICKNKPVDELDAGKNCLTRSQTFMASMISKNQEFLKTSRLKKEVFEIMRPDEISSVAKNDPLICLYGETLLNKHKRQQICTVVSNKIREMGRLLIALKSINTEICGFFDVLKPEMFQSLISTAKMISGYDENTKSFKAPSLALHMGTNLKIICDVAFKIVVEERILPKIKWDNKAQKKSEIKDLKKLIEAHWCNELSSLALKTLKERQWEKPVALPLTSDIQLFQTYLDKLANDAYSKLKCNVDVRLNYKKLAECVLTQTVMFNRKRVGDVQYLKIATYNNNNSTVNQEAFMDSLTNVEKTICKKFKRVVTGGKGSKPIPILFSKRMQKFITILLEIREDSNLVPKSNPYLFANPGSKDKWMAGVNIIRKLAMNCGASNPSVLTSTKFRKHIATTLQLMSMEEDEIEQIATFMGHTKKTHAEFYRLPQDIYQTAKVAKVLMLLEKGKGKEFRGKSLNEIKLDTDVYYSSESEDEKCADDLQAFTEQDLNDTLDVDTPLSTNITAVGNSLENRCTVTSSSLDAVENPRDQVEGNMQVEQIRSKLQLNLKRHSDNEVINNSNEEPAIKKTKVSTSKNQKIGRKPSGRIRWCDAEKKLVLQHFHQHIKKKIAPKKHECQELLNNHRDVLISKDWVRIKTFVYNTFRDK